MYKLKIACTWNCVCENKQFTNKIKQDQGKKGKKIGYYTREILT